MKVVGLVKFYFPHRLPRGPDWGAAKIGLLLGPTLAIVRPRSADEPVFPDAIDKTLQSLQVSMQPVGEDGRLQMALAGAVDRITVQVSRDQVDFEQLRAGPLERELVSDAVEACNIFIETCRAEGRVPFLQGVQQDITREGGRFILTPHTVTWFDAETRAGLPVYLPEDGGTGNAVNARADAGAMRSPVRDTVSMERVIQSVRARKSTLVNGLLTDAHEWLVTQRLREGVIALGSACEIVSNEYLVRKGANKTPAVEKILKMGKSFATKRFDLVPTHLQSRSLNVDNSGAFSLVESAYRTRNSVVHAGALSYADATGAIQPVDQRRAFDFLRACTEAVDWMNSLP